MGAVLGLNEQILQGQKFIADQYYTIYLLGFVTSWDKAENKQKQLKNNKKYILQWNAQSAASQLTRRSSIKSLELM